MQYKFRRTESWWCNYAWRTSTHFLGLFRGRSLLVCNHLSIYYLSNYLFFSAGHFQSVRPYRMGPVVQELITDGGVNLMQMLGLPDKSGEQFKNLCVSIRASNEPSRRWREILCLKCISASRCYQPGEGPSRGLLCDCKVSRNLRKPSFEALISRGHIMCNV